jgi:hypothetical protein
MSGTFVKRAAVAALLIGAAGGVPRAEAQVSGGVSRIFLPPVKQENPAARRLFAPPVAAPPVAPPPPPLVNSYSPMSYGSPGGYGGYNRGMNQYQQAAAAPMPQAVDKNPELAKAITATGVFNKDGKVEWPLGLRILPGDDVDRLRIQLSAMFQVLGAQMVQGAVNPQLLGEINETVDRLAVLLVVDRDTRRSLTSTNLYEESARFLGKMREATRIAVAVQPAGQSNPYLSSQTAGGTSSPAQPAQTAGKNPY